MPTYKVAILYQCFGQGWTENFYISASSAQAASVLSSAGQRALVNIHSLNTVLQAIRASNVALPRDSWLELYGATPSTFGIGNGTPDVTATCNLLQLTAGTTAKRKLWLRGLPDGFVVRDPTTGESAPSSGFLSTFDNWKTVVLARGYQIRSLIPTSTPGYNWIPIDSLAAGGGGAGTVVNTHGAHGLATNDVVYFSRIPQDQLPGLRGNFKVTVTSGTQFGIAYLWRGSTSTILPQNASVRKAGYNYTNISTVDYGQFLTRQTGRPFGVPRGRSPARIRRT